MLLTFVLTFFVYLASLIVLPALTLIFDNKYGTGWRLFYVVAALQGIIAFAILLPVLTKFPTAAAVILPGVLAAGAGIIGVTGLVLYALLFFLIYRPDNWKRNSLWLSGASAVVIIGLVGPSLIAKSGVTTNVDLHGIVTDIDGQPVPNAEVHVKNCPYLHDPMPVTDAQGRFRVVANCRYTLMIDHIRNRDTMTNCQSWFPSSSEYGLMVFNSRIGAVDPVRDPSWANYPAENPIVIPCVWFVPDAVRHHMSSHHDFPVDGRTVTIAPEPRGRDLEHIDGDHDGLFHIAFIAGEDSREDPSLPVTGRLRISPVSGGIQVTGDYGPFNAAPAEGYQPYVELALEDAAQKVDESFYFYSYERRVYGSLRVWMNYSFDYGTQTFRSPLGVRLETYVNYAGGRPLLTHKVVYQ